MFWENIERKELERQRQRAGWLQTGQARECLRRRCSRRISAPR